MNTKRQKRISLLIGLAAGVLIDGYLRLNSGDEGNLLIHSLVFLGSFLIVAGAVYGLLHLKRKK